MQLQQEHPLSALANDSGPAVRQPKYTPLKGHISDASPFNLMSRTEFTRKDGTATANSKAGAAAAKPKLDGGTGNKLEATRCRVPPKKQWSSPFVQTMHRRETPDGACFVAWTGRPGFAESKVGTITRVGTPQPPSPEPPTAYLAPLTPQEGP